MKNSKAFLILFLCGCFAWLNTFCCISTTHADNQVAPAELLMEQLYLAVPQNRTAGSVGEAQAASILGAQMLVQGATSLLMQEFSVGNSTSKNVIAFLPSVVQSTNTVIFGAHYDNVYSSQSNGYGDNLSGVCALMQTIQKIKNKNHEFNAIFVLFGSEEIGALGSKHFLSNLTKQEKDRIYLFINIDSVGLGEQLFFSNGGAVTNYLKFIRRVNTDLNSRFIEHAPNLTYPSVGIKSVNSLLSQSDMQPFVQEGINAVTLFAGSKTSFFERWKESSNHAPIAHKTDSKEVALSVFGNQFAFNIEYASDFASKIPLSNNFFNMSIPMQTTPIFFNVFFVKLLALVASILVLFVGFFALGKNLCHQNLKYISY